ncbi:hypothetical protein [Marinimicrobium sp. ABcell2]|uniref:hypothetical protein n=1 Tax=Marinimicrobium sp. ABcell2 TaxID=3069751 RepID=UPI0027B68756|nr:hypothetical protein [Marinimicrobium sp. ABcell2]MDQ2077419.1 hypothetical protein [Marinimicrobium sp. ABcell2]
MPFSKDQFSTLVSASKRKQFSKTCSVPALFSPSAFGETWTPETVECRIQELRDSEPASKSLEHGPLESYLLGGVVGEDVYEPGDLIVRNDNMSAGLCVYGRWASHTGYRSLLGNTAETPEQLYQRAQAAPFLVGPADAECWPVLRDSWVYKGALSIRLSDWHSGEVAFVLHELAGLVLECPINNFWAFDKSVEKAQIRRLIAPIVTKGTRLADEAKLAEQIRRSDVADELLGSRLQASLI